MKTSSVSLEFCRELAEEIDRRRQSRDYGATFAFIDERLPRYFVGNELPATAGELMVLSILAGKKAGMMAEIAGAEMVDGQGNHAGWAVPADQTEAVLGQILGHYQLALNANSALMSLADVHDATLFRPLLLAGLNTLHDEFLAWADKLGPGGQALPPLPAIFAQMLFTQHWGVHAFAGAEDLLFLARDLLAKSGADGAEQGTRDIAIAFYQFLQGLTDEQLLAGGLPRAELADAMAELGVTL